MFKNNLSVFSGFDPSPSYSGSYSANPAFTGSKWGVPSSGFAPAAPRPNPATTSKVAPPQTAPHREHGYPPPSVQKDPAAASYSSNSFAAPVHSEYASSASAGSTYPGSVEPTFNQGNYCYS